jgi:hypothetical protein
MWSVVVGKAPASTDSGDAEYGTWEDEGEVRVVGPGKRVEDAARNEASNRDQQENSAVEPSAICNIYWGTANLSTRCNTKAATTLTRTPATACGIRATEVWSGL